MSAAVKPNTGQLMELLKRHYIKPGQSLPGGVFLPEVGWNNGSGGGGCDAIYVGFTTTSGRILVGHELKVSRADWLNELNKPGKSDAWADECHEWWLVVNDPAIVHDGELPAGWGLMSPGKSKTRMTIHHKPDRKGREHRPSWLACRSIMARQDTLRANAIADAAKRQHDEACIENLEVVTSAEHGVRHTWRPLTTVCPVCGTEFTPHKTKRGRTKTCGQRCGAQLTWRTRRGAA